MLMQKWDVSRGPSSPSGPSGNCEEEGSVPAVRVDRHRFAREDPVPLAATHAVTAAIASHQAEFLRM
jgi:hypothetical protein